jgi:hypothetical protein
LDQIRLLKKTTLKRNGSLVVPKDGFSFKHVSAGSVEKAISALDNNSSSGITEIPVSVFKHCSILIAPILATLFNQFIDSGEIPHDLKRAIAFLLFKKGDATNCDNYRGISVLSPFAKVFESQQFKLPITLLEMGYFQIHNMVFVRVVVAKQLFRQF